MSINLSTNFSENAQLPLDSRIIQADSTARDAIATIQRYFGLVVILKSDGSSWIMADASMGGTDSNLANNSNWISYSGAGQPSFSEVIGDGVTTTFTISHNLGNHRCFSWKYSIQEQRL